MAEEREQKPLRGFNLRVKLTPRLIREIQHAAERLPVSERWIRNAISKDLQRQAIARWEGKVGEYLGNLFQEMAAPASQKENPEHAK